VRRQREKTNAVYLIGKRTLYRASSKSNNGPVVPTINSGCPENSEKMTPATDVAISVSDMPMKFFVLSAKKVVRQKR